MMRHWMTLIETPDASDLEVYPVRSKNALHGLLRRFGWVRLALHADTMVGWDASDFTHGDYVEVYGEHINLNVTQEHGVYIVEFSPPHPDQDVRIHGTTPQELRSNPAFQRVFKTLRVQFRDHNTWEDVNETVDLTEATIATIAQITDDR